MRYDCFQHPPLCEHSGGEQSRRYIHDYVAHGKERTRRERFGKKTRQVSGAGHKWDRDVMRLDAFSHEEMTAVSMFGPLMVFRVVCQVDRGLVIHVQRRRLLGRQSQIVEKSAQVNSFFCRLRSGDYFSFARKRYAGLLLRAQ
eukprot:6174676-Pleurochrysis_carterae.AAC.1